MTVASITANSPVPSKLRNYGIHPRGHSSQGQEQAFTDQGAGLIIMQTHRYLGRLNDAVSQALASDTGQG